MFARTITIKGKKYYRIVESYRVNGKVKQAYVCSLGEGETGKENAERFLGDDSGYTAKLDLVKDNPKVKRLVCSLVQKSGYETRRKGENSNIWEGRARKLHCPESDKKVTIRVLKDSGTTICLEAGRGRECNKCDFNEGK